MALKSHVISDIPIWANVKEDIAESLWPFCRLRLEGEINRRERLRIAPTIDANVKF